MLCYVILFIYLKENNVAARYKRVYSHQDDPAKIVQIDPNLSKRSNNQRKKEETINAKNP